MPDASSAAAVVETAMNVGNLGTWVAGVLDLVVSVWEDIVSFLTANPAILVGFFLIPVIGYAIVYLRRLI